MERQYWCEHSEKISKYTLIHYELNDKIITQRIQAWFCPECGTHGAHSEIINAK